MNRVSGWYKRTTQVILFGVGFALAAALNINTITLVNYLYRDDSARAALVARAQAAAQDTTLRNSTNYPQARAALDSLSLPIGWQKGVGTTNKASADLTGGQKAWFFLFAPFFGWLLTALAAAMGAPFWFDLLSKVMVIRSTAKPPEKSPDVSPEDRQKDKRVETVAPTIRVTPPAPQQPAPEQPAPDAAAPEQSPRSQALSMVVAGMSSDIDGCDADMGDGDTADEDLPPSRGGVR